MPSLLEGLSDDVPDTVGPKKEPIWQTELEDVPRTRVILLYGDAQLQLIQVVGDVDLLDQETVGEPGEVDRSTLSAGDAHGSSYTDTVYILGAELKVPLTKRTPTEMAEKPELTREVIRERCTALQNEIERLLRASGVQPNHLYTPNWTIDGDRKGGDLGLSKAPYTGTIRVKVSNRDWNTCQFISNKQGKLKDIHQVVAFIIDVYEYRRDKAAKEKEARDREEAAEPEAAKLREEFHVKELSGDFRILADTEGLKVQIDAVGTPQQIRDLMSYAWKIGMFKPAGSSPESLPESPTIFDRINEEES